VSSSAVDGLVGDALPPLKGGEGVCVDHIVDGPDRAWEHTRAALFAASLGSAPEHVEVPMCRDARMKLVLQGNFLRMIGG